MLALVRPKLVRRLILVGTGPRGGEGMAGLKSSTAELFAKQYERQDEMWLPIMFAPSETSQAAARAYLERIRRRPDRDAPVSTEAGLAHRAAAGVWGRPNTDGFADLRRIAQPTLVVNGSDDIVIPTVNSFVFDASYVPPGAALGRIFEAVLGHRVAVKICRNIVKRIARKLTERERAWRPEPTSHCA